MLLSEILIKWTSSDWVRRIFQGLHFICTQCMFTRC